MISFIMQNLEKYLVDNCLKSYKLDSSGVFVHLHFKRVDGADELNVNLLYSYHFYEYKRLDILEHYINNYPKDNLESINISEIEYIEYHYLNAMKEVTKNFIEDLKNNQDFYKKCFNEKEKDNLIDNHLPVAMLFFLGDHNDYEYFLKNRQNNSSKGYDDYLCHTLFLDLEHLSQIFDMEIGYQSTIYKYKKEYFNTNNQVLKLEEDFSKTVSGKIFDLISTEAHKINAFQEHLLPDVDEKKLKEYKEKAMNYFLNYELAKMHLNLMGFSANIKKESFEEFYKKNMNMESSVSIHEDKIKITVDKQLKSIKSELCFYLNTFSNEMYMLDYIKKSDYFEGDNVVAYKQNLATSINIEIELKDDVKNKKELLIILQSLLSDFIFNKVDDINWVYKTGVQDFKEAANNILTETRELYLQTLIKIDVEDKKEQKKKVKI